MKIFESESDMEDFEKYLTTIENEENRIRMRQVLAWVIKRFPDLRPKIAWNQPMFTDHDTFIIGFSVSRQHIAVAPESVAIEKFSAEIARSGYSQSSQIFRIRWEEEVDFSLLEQIIQYNRKDKADCTSFWRK